MKQCTLKKCNEHNEISYPINNFMTKHFPCPLRLFWQQRFLNDCNSVPCTLKNDAKGSENVLQFYPVFYFQRTAKLAGFTYCWHRFQVKGDLVWPLKPPAPPSSRFSFYFHSIQPQWSVTVKAWRWSSKQQHTIRVKKQERTPLCPAALIKPSWPWGFTKTCLRLESKC